jgi:hypothetical protein
MIHEDDNILTCSACGEEMLYWQLDSHVSQKHGNHFEWRYVGDDKIGTLSVCQYCAEIMIQNYGMTKTTPYGLYTAQDDGTDITHSLYMPNKVEEAFRCATCWERNH